MATIHLCDACGRQAKHHEIVQCHGCGKDLCPRCATTHRARVAGPDGPRLGIALPCCGGCREARVAAEEWAASDEGRAHLARLGGA